MLTKPYSVSFEIWDVTKSEEKGERLAAKEIKAEPLGAFLEPWRQFVAGKLGPESLLVAGAPDIHTLRVAMSRNHGEGIVRTRFTYEDKRYRVDTRARRIFGVTEAMIEAGITELDSCMEAEAEMDEACRRIYEAMEAKK